MGRIILGFLAAILLVIGYQVATPDDVMQGGRDAVDDLRNIPIPKIDTGPAPGNGALVARVIDGDTVELRNGSDVRVVGIDTPERGQCGYAAATDNMRALVEGERVRLVQPNGQDTDRYGRLIRVIKINGRDAGLAQIRGGFAIARYDSTDGYPAHPKQDRYHAATDAAETKRAQVQATCEEESNR